MREARAVRITALCLGIVSFVCLVGYYLARHDIFRDYVSREVLENVRITSAAALPQWTSCSGEWRLLGVGFWPMLLFHVLFFVTFFRRTRRRMETPSDEVSRFAPPSAWE
jgi:hypothetical protein